MLPRVPEPPAEGLSGHARAWTDKQKSYTPRCTPCIYIYIYICDSAARLPGVRRGLRRIYIYMLFCIAGLRQGLRRIYIYIYIYMRFRHLVGYPSINQYDAFKAGGHIYVYTYIYILCIYTHTLSLSLWTPCLVAPITS